MSIPHGDVPSLGQNSSNPGRGVRRPHAPNDSSRKTVWTCVPCRRKKIKCDKSSPCSNCTKSHTECVASASGRAARKPRKNLDPELLEDRLARLEATAYKVRGRESNGNVPSFPKENDEVELFRQWRNVSKFRNVPRRESRGQSVSTGSYARSHDSSKLLSTYRGTNYYHACCWAGLAPESTSPSDEDSVASASRGSPVLPSFIFQPALSGFDLASFHPPSESIPCMWYLFQRNVEPLAKVFHVPSMDSEISEATKALHQLPRGMEVLMFAIYHGVVCSLDEEECVQLFGESKKVLAGRYRFALEQALANADFLDSSDLAIPRALIIFLTVLRTTDKARVIWTLTGLLTRIAQKIGLHKDGSHFDLSPFEVEIRRRLWWQVCVMDARASEDHGCSSTILEAQFDTQMPLNINDNDLHSNMTDLPSSRKGITDMTICLVSFELANTFRRMSSVITYTSPTSPSYSALTVDQKDEWVSECHRRMKNTYLADNPDLSVPSLWMATTLTLLLLSKMRLMAHHPLPEADKGDTDLPEYVKEDLLKSSIETIEYSNLLGSDARGRDMVWFSRTCFQWHSVVFVFSALCNDAQGTLIDRAWAAVEEMIRLQGPDISSDPRYAHLYQSVRRLLVKARMAREKVLMSRSGALNSGTGYDFQIVSYPAIDSMLRHGNRMEAPIRTIQGAHNRSGF